MAVETKRICNGTFGEIWLDGDYVGEIKKAQAKVEFNKEEIKQCGVFFTDSKAVKVRAPLPCLRSIPVWGRRSQIW